MQSYKKSSKVQNFFVPLSQNFKLHTKKMNEKITNIIELAQAPMRTLVLTDQQIQQLSLDEIQQRYLFLEETLSAVLDYDVVISDTNIWLELLVGHTSSHSDPRVNARLQFERQLEFISKLAKHRGGKFIMMGETYEEIDRFAALQDPTNHKEADFTDNVVCLNTAARLAKRLILAQQRENRLRIEGISAESHHAAFADPAIVHRVAELFAQGKRVLLLTNDASVAIRSIGLCDDLQRTNNISDHDWDTLYAPLRPMVFTFDDLKLLDYYTRQFHYLQMASGNPWMADIAPAAERTQPQPLTLWQEAFRPGDKRRGDNLFITEQEVAQNAAAAKAPAKSTPTSEAQAEATAKATKKPAKASTARKPKKSSTTKATVETPKETQTEPATTNKATKASTVRKPRKSSTTKATAAPPKEAPTEPTPKATAESTAKVTAPKKTTRRRPSTIKKS